MGGRRKRKFNRRGWRMKGVREQKRFSSRNYEEGWEADNEGDVRTGDRHSRV